MAREFTRPTQVSAEEFERLFESVRAWGRWGPDDELGTLNYVTPEKIRAAAALGFSTNAATLRTPSLALPMGAPSRM